jgi:hypothetical protein
MKNTNTGERIADLYRARSASPNSDENITTKTIYVLSSTSFLFELMEFKSV